MSAVPGEPVNLSDLERLAEARLPAGPWGYYAGGAGDERTLADNAAAWGRRHLRPRVLVDVETIDTSTTVLGIPVRFPVLVAPVALQKMAHPDGEAGMARAAGTAGTAMCLSTIATSTPAEVAAHIVERLRPGAIVDMHDSIGRGLFLPQSDRIVETLNA